MGRFSEVGLVKPAPFLGDEELEDRDVISEGNAPRSPNASTEDGKEVLEAQGWMINDRGNIELVAYKTDPNGSPTQPKYDQICHK